MNRSEEVLSVGEYSEWLEAECKGNEVAYVRKWVEEDVDA